MTTHPFIIATAGHVDHGKSALVKALTGTDPDRLPEEKARAITIDLGFAHWQLPSPTRPTTQYSLGIVDVPGHEDFVKNMVAGVGSIDLALLVVAADDGWMPQSEEHLQILAYLGVPRAVVALSKIDLCPEPAAAMARVREHLRSSALADVPIVPCSAATGQGLEELGVTVATLLDSTPPPADAGKPRLPVDRVFSLRGVGTIVTGTLTGGSLHRGQAVLIQPTGQPARLRSLQTHNQDVDTVVPGTRVAVNLPDIAAGRWSDGGVARGAIVTIAELGAATQTVDVWLEKSARLRNTTHPGARPIKDGAIVRVHHGSANWPARVLLRAGQPILPGESGLAQLRFDRSVFLLGGDRFIVRDWPELVTLAGGIVLDADADRRQFRSEAQGRLLEQRALSPNDPRAWLASQCSRNHAVQRTRCLVRTRFSAAAIEAAVSALLAAGEILDRGEWLVHGRWWTALQQKAVAAIEAQHRDHPEDLGYGLNDLRQALASDATANRLFDVLLADLLRHGFAQIGAKIKRANHLPALPPALQAAGQKLRAVLAAKPFEPPSRKTLAPDNLSQTALRFLCDTGEAVDLGADTVLTAESFARARRLIVGHLRAQGAATASEIRQLLSTSRRIVIPLLERLDRDGVTVRQGDKRILGNRSSAR